MNPRNRSPWQGYFLVAGMSIFWGLSWPVMKIALMEIPPWTFRTISLVCGGAGILALAKFRGEALSIPKNQLLPLILVSLLNVTGWHLGSAHGINLMQAGRAVIVGFTMPVWASILASLVLKEKFTPKKITGLLLGLAGLFILIQPQLVSMGGTPFGIVIMLCAAISWGAGTVFIKYFTWTLPTVLLTGWQLIIGSLPVIAGAIIFESRLMVSDLSPQAILSMLYVILFPMLFCHLAWFTVVGIFPASTAAISTLAIPVIGVISSGLILHESIGFQEGIALILVVTAVTIVLFWPETPKPDRFQ